MTNEERKEIESIEKNLKEFEDYLFSELKEDTDDFTGYFGEHINPDSLHIPLSKIHKAILKIKQLR